jgi:hypothetical protein
MRAGRSRHKADYYMCSHVLSGKRYIALKTAHLSWDCVVIVKSREIWEEWRATVYGKWQTPRCSDTCPDLTMSICLM